jgi:serine/threonine protein kinase
LRKLGLKTRASDVFITKVTLFGFGKICLIFGNLGDLDRISREIKILKKIKHPSIVQLYEIVETDEEIYLIMEYCNGGELFDYIVSKQRLREREA